ncbi:response regulator transcription factor, partial [Chitinimonas sp.]|uniref:response regulator transcription factor n=1 Tax=Chitinimonas sp. TaxID=1934313 RepID=UPI0035B3C24A
MDNKQRVLSADDESFIQEMIVEALSERYQVTTADDGADALQKVAQCQPDIVILDVEMP